MKLSAIWARAKNLVEKNGWATMSVCREPDARPPTPDFTYSIGLSTKGLPDIIVFGLHQSLAQTLIADVASRLLQRPHAADCQPVKPGEPILDLVSGKRAMLLEVAPDIGAKHALLALDYAEENKATLQIWQLVWPDQKGLLPWENGVAPEAAAVQPILGRSMTH